MYNSTRGPFDPKRCVFCGVHFKIEERRDRSIPREMTLSSLASDMERPVRAMFDTPNDTNLKVIATLAASAPDGCLCNYCHTRVTVSRDAAEAL